MTANKIEVAIIGAGIGGLATALSLRKQGINAQVYEKARTLLLIDAGLTLFPNGLNSLAEISPAIVDSLKSAGSQTRVVKVQKSNGEIAFQNHITLAEKYGQPMLNIRWSRLQEILAAALPPDTIHLNYRCNSFQQNDSSVEVSFDNGQTVRADLLIGADGINSVVRQQLIGDGSPRYAGRMSWRAVIKYNHELLAPNEVTLITGSQGKNFVLIDVGGGYIFWSAGSLTTDDTLSPPSAVKSRVLEEFAGWAEPIKAIVEATDDIVERPIWDRPPLASWSQGRVTLMGDAAHPIVPSLGQGANMAFEDACVLGCLGNTPSIEAALAIYESIRLPRTQVIHARSAFVGNRSYEADSEKYFQGVLDEAKFGNDEFEEWLYNYDPVTLN
jgi:salicylate hydroxylase